MGVSVSIFDALGFLIVVSVLFLPVFWFAFYALWEGLRWRRESARRQSTVFLETSSPAEQEESQTGNSQKAA